MGLRLIFNYGRDAQLVKLVGEDRAAGGIITGLFALTRTLAARGHEVHVFGRCRRPGERNGVHFHDRSIFAAFTEANPADALVLVPDLLPLLMPVPARARVVWTGNAFASGDCALSAPWSWAPEIGKSGLRARLYSLALFHSTVDRMFVKSEWQAGYIASRQGVPPEKFVVMHNGVPLEYFDGPPPTHNRHRIVYTSQARRGLDVLLRLFPAIRERVPDAELHIFGYGSVAYPDDGSGRNGVVLRGSVSKSQLALELRSSAVMAYPCTFKETFCTSVAEAQAAGLPVVTTDLAALAERVEDGVDGRLVAGPADRPGFAEAFVGAVVHLLMDDATRQRQGAAASAKAHSLYAWDHIARSWERELEGLALGDIAAARLEPPLEFLAPPLLHIEDRGAAADVPADLARGWLREAWASYGFDPDSIPGLREARSARP